MCGLHRRAVVVLGLAAVGLGAGAPQVPRPSGSILVSAAVSLTEAMQAIARDFEQREKAAVALNFGASSALAGQIVAGAPVDLFVSADEAQMDRLAQAGRIVPGTQVNLLSNRLVVIVPRERGVSLTKAADLLGPQIRRVAIADPNGVPVGVYARQYLERAGVWSALLPCIVPTGSARAALAAAESGSVDAAIVYRTDTTHAARVTTAFEVPPDQAPVILYPAALVTGGRSEALARAFLLYLQSPAAQAVFEREGFIVLGGQR